MVKQVIILLSPILDKTLDIKKAEIDDLFHQKIVNDKLTVELKIRYHKKRTFDIIVRRTYHYYREQFPEPIPILLRWRPRMIV